MNEKFPYVVVVILTWNKKDILIECVESVLKLDYPSFDIVVVDNHSLDGSAEAVASRFPEITMIRNDRNLGAIEGKNVGLTEALKRSADYIFVLDNDLIAAPDALKQMIALFQSDEKIGMVGAKIYDYEKPDLILSCGSKIDFTQNIVRQYGRGQIEKGQFEQIKDVDFLGMGHTLIKRELMDEIGLLDTSFIGYGYEDVDYGVRARESGWRVVYSPRAKVWHRPHSGVGTYTFKKKYMEARNAIVFMRKHAGFRDWLKYSFFLAAGFLYALIVEGLRGNIGGVYGKALGIIHGFQGRESLSLQLMNPEISK